MVETFKENIYSQNIVSINRKYDTIDASEVSSHLVLQKDFKYKRKKSEGKNDKK